MGKHGVVKYTFMRADSSKRTDPSDVLSDLETIERKIENEKFSH